MRPIDLIIFDLDGTLVDSAPDIINSVNFALKELGFEEISPEEIRLYIGTGVQDLILKSLGKGRTGFFDKGLETFESHYRKHFADNLRLYPGVKDVLEHFKDKRKIIISNKKREFSILTLKATGIDGYFEDIIGGDDVKCTKPSPCPLDRAIAKFGVKKKRAIIVGDMYIDVLSGKEAGILTCGVTYGIGRKGDIVKAGPDFIIDEIGKLKDLIL